MKILNLIKRLLPCLLAIICIFTLASCKKKTSPLPNPSINSSINPTIKNADDVYLTLDDLKITNERLYTYMKQFYGIEELQRLVDNVIYEDKIKEVNVASESLDNLNDFDKYIMENIFPKVLKSNDTEGIKENNEEIWTDIINSLKMNNLIDNVADDQTSAYKLDSKVWEVVRQYYALDYARREVAKENYKKQLLKEREDADKVTFDENDNPIYFDEDDFKEYYEENYSDNVLGLFIPFTSEEAALKAMASVGINTNSTVLGKNGWIKADFDYNYSSGDIPEDQYLTSTEVFAKFIELYNIVYKYLDREITSSDYTTNVLSQEKTLSKIVKALTRAMRNNKTVYGNVILPLEITVENEEDNASIIWEVTNGTNLTLSEDGKTLVYTSPDYVKKGHYAESVTVKVTATIKYMDQTETTETFEFTVEPTEKADADVTIVVEQVSPFYVYSFDQEKLSEKDIQIAWSTSELTEINSSLASLMKVNSTRYTLSDDAENFYKQYTVKPQKCGDYYFLAIKWGKEIIADYNDETIKAEIQEKLLENEFIYYNTIEKMIYEARQEAELTIYDRYLEAIYDYNYTYFYETTLKLTDYPKYIYSEKTESSIVAKFKVNGTEHKITADELYDELEDKYGVITSIDLINQYRVVSSEFNKIYNPYTNEILDEETYNDLLENEVGGFRKDFELDYFTNSYLSYYGFTPNFPGTYGWNNFIKDYFGAYTNEELLANLNFGGSVYSKAVTDLTESLYTTAGETTWEETDVKKAMDKAHNEWYGLKVINLLVCVDNNYDNTIDTQSDKYISDEENNVYNFETTTWTDEQINLAPRLIEQIVNLIDLNDNVSVYNQLNKIVANYKEASFEAPIDEPTEFDTIYTYNYWAEFKKAGLMVKVESAQDYNNSSALIDEFLDELKTMYNEIKSLGYEGTFDVPYVSSRNCLTTYGYHRIFALGVTEVPELPSEEDVLIYNLVQKASDNANATVAYKKALYEEAVKELKDNYNIEYTSDYTIDEDLESRIEQWYTNAVDELSGTNVLSHQFINYLKSVSGNIVCSNQNYNKILNSIIEISEKYLEEE